MISLQKVLAMRNTRLHH